MINIRSEFRVPYLGEAKKLDSMTLAKLNGMYGSCCQEVISRSGANDVVLMRILQISGTDKYFRI